MDSNSDIQNHKRMLKPLNNHVLLKKKNELDRKLQNERIKNFNIKKYSESPISTENIQYFKIHSKIKGITDKFVQNNRCTVQKNHIDDEINPVDRISNDDFDVKINRPNISIYSSNSVMDDHNLSYRKDSTREFRKDSNESYLNEFIERNQDMKINFQLETEHFLDNVKLGNVICQDTHLFFKSNIRDLNKLELTFHDLNKDFVKIKDNSFTTPIHKYKNGAHKYQSRKNFDEHLRKIDILTKNNRTLSEYPNSTRINFGSKQTMKNDQKFQNLLKNNHTPSFDSPKLSSFQKPRGNRTDINTTPNRKTTKQQSELINKEITVERF